MFYFWEAKIVTRDFTVSLPTDPKLHTWENIFAVVKGKLEIEGPMGIVRTDSPSDPAGYVPERLLSEIAYFRGQAEYELVQRDPVDIEKLDIPEPPHCKNCACPALPEVHKDYGPWETRRFTFYLDPTIKVSKEHLVKVTQMVTNTIIEWGGVIK